MKQYHYSEGVNSYGPFTLDELKTKNISRETLIWSEDFVTWKKAGEVPELQGLFIFTATPQTPPTPHTSPDPTLQRPPKSYLIETILATIFCCLPLGIVSIVYATQVEKKFYRGDVQGAQDASNNAKRWLMITVGASILLIVGYFAIFGLVSTSWVDIDGA